MEVSNEAEAPANANAFEPQDDEFQESVLIDEPVELLEIAEPAQEGQATNHYMRCGIPLAKIGQPIARIRRPEEVKLGPNVQLLEDGVTIAATLEGRVHLNGGCVWVDKSLEITGDVDFSTGCIEFDKDVIIHGSVLDLFKVTAGGSVRVAGAVEAAEVRAALDLLVGGGIIGKDKGRCYAGNDIQAKFISNALIEVGNDVMAQTEIAHSRVICGGRVVVEHGNLLAGHITARGGIKCAVLGCAAGSPTLVEAGIDQGLCQLIADNTKKIEADQEKIIKIRESVEPLMRNQKSLTAAQKEKATELLFQCSEAEEANRSILGKLKTKRDEAATKGNAGIIITSAILPGVTIRFPSMEAKVTSTIKGRLKIVPRGTGQQRRVMVERPAGHGPAFPLDTLPFLDKPSATLTRLLTAANMV